MDSPLDIEDLPTCSITFTSASSPEIHAKPHAQEHTWVVVFICVLIYGVPVGVGSNVASSQYSADPICPDSHESDCCLGCSLA